MVNQKLTALTPLKDQVQKRLETRLNQSSDMATIAQALNLSTRTLIRRLQAEGTTFPVSYTHLDVYKRQAHVRSWRFRT